MIATERPLFVVGGDDVLAQLGADGFEKVAKVADYREVTKNRVAALNDVVEHHASGQNG